MISVTSPDDSVFVGIDGRHLESSALRRPFRTAQTRTHDLLLFGVAEIVQTDRLPDLADQPPGSRADNAAATIAFGARSYAS